MPNYLILECVHDTIVMLWYTHVIVCHSKNGWWLLFDQSFVFPASQAGDGTVIENNIKTLTSIIFLMQSLTDQVCSDIMYSEIVINFKTIYLRNN
jgi:hypothetical protein